MIVTPEDPIPLADWVARVEEVRASGFTWFDSLGAGASPRAAEGAVDVWLLLARPEAAPQGPRVRMLTTRVAAGEALPSVTRLFAGAAFCEREAHEMFGLPVEGFDDGTGAGLRHLLLDDADASNPLRKDVLLAERAERPWPGAVEPGESRATAQDRRRRRPPGVPDEGRGR